MTQAIIAQARDFKTQYRLALSASEEELVVDYFCGGGGAGTGLEIGLGRPVHIAKNHNADAISMHEANHPFAKHLNTDVFNGDPREETRDKPVAWFHLSPDCTHFSQASGGQPRKKAVRDLSWVGCKWAGIVKPRVISLENVLAIQKWGALIAKRDPATGRVLKKVTVLEKGKERIRYVVAEPGERVPVQDQYLIPDEGYLDGKSARRRKRAIKFARHGAPGVRTWRQFVAHLESLGYAVEWKVLRACDYGAATIRSRLFMIARCDGHPIVWPEPTHAAEPKPWQEPYRTAAECIDWNIPCPSVFEREKPLADATLKRIAKGIQKFVLDKAQPFIVPVANWSNEAIQSVEQPLRTITAWPKGGSFALAVPTLVQVGYGERKGQEPRVPGIDKPLGTIVAGGVKHALVSAFLAQANGGFNSTPAHDVECPMSTITSSGSQQQLVTTLLSSTVTEQRASRARRVAGFLMQYYSCGGQWGELDKPLGTVTTKDRLALVTVTLEGTPYVIVDIGFRMLQPRELYRAQGFPDSYVIETGHDGRVFTKADQVRMVGNSVCPHVMAAIAYANDPWRSSILQETAA